MFEKRLEIIAKKFDGPKRKFYVLTHKKHRREICFRNKKDAIDFIKIKFDTPKKKFIYFLIKIGLLQPFLKKINLPEEFGDAIFIANNIKCFDLDKMRVLSLLKEDRWKRNFLNEVKFRKARAAEGYAPNVIEINEKIPFSREELLAEYSGGDDLGVFERIYSWYEKRGFKRIDSSKYVKNLSAKIKKKKIKNTFVEETIGRLSKEKKKLILSDLHGSFSKEQILVRGGSYVFVDWSEDEGFGKDLVIRDLANFFREDVDLLGSRDFLELLKIYPENVRENIHLYLILNELSSIARRGVFDFNVMRIKNVLRHKLN
jgi:hypothetical protein